MTSSMTTWFAKEPLLPRNLDLEKMFVAEDQTIHLMDANGRVHIVGTLEELRERLQKGDNDSIIYTIMSFPSRVVFCVEVEGYSHTLFMATEKKLGFVENYRNIGRRDSRVVLEEIPSRRQLGIKISNDVHYTGFSVDCKGRVWLMAVEGENSYGQLFSLAKDWKQPMHRYWCPERFSGICWSLDDKTIYINETARKNYILAYDFDIETGVIRMHEERIFYEFPNPTEYPLAFVIDSRDHMWCAVAGTGKIIRISPKSEVVGEIYLPDHHEPIDLQFVGNELVILTKRNVAQEEVLLRGGTYHGLVMNAKEASHGNIFTADIGYTGKPGHLYNLGPEELSLLKKSRLLFEKKTGSSAEEVMDFLRTYRRRQPSPNV
ncbi:putative calcium homeostasis protein [Botrytis cinerea BcDW1]|uniref:Putative calcium homeostasis protein n=1 Tax=Botryotinia fuckeliana (strain BcDW1) TaxID=1290391 RepID=M7UH00_BOTF1|nr:putative calcium homeostasis protein [Botrytis cinerea BcDW1]